MTRIKICGITNLDDARAAVEAGADWLGFIAVPNTPRFVTPEMVAAIARELPPLVTTVAVTRTVAEAALYPTSAVQFYGGPASDTKQRRLIRVFRIRDERSLDEIRDFDADVAAVLLDTYHDRALGGVGEVFDWQLAVAAKAVTDHPIILAGGLTPENVAAAVEKVQPFAVDVGSGVEAEPGRKDHDTLRRFVQAVKSAHGTETNSR